MDKEQIIKLVSEKIKLVRTEKGYNQSKMAEVLGISKKTLVQIEKGRVLANWTIVISICALFRDSEILQSTFGDDPLEIVLTIAHRGIESSKDKTMGGKVWWKEIERNGHFRLQQNLISQHYRILDQEDYRWYSSFDKKETLNYLENIVKKTERGE